MPCERDSPIKDYRLGCPSIRYAYGTMGFRGIFPLLLVLNLIVIVTSGPVRSIRATIRTPAIQRGYRRDANGDYFEFISKAQTHNPPPQFRIEKGPNGHLWEVTIRRTVHIYEGRRRMISSSGSAQAAILPRTQTLSAGSKMPQSCDCEPTRSRSTGRCWYFTRKDSNICMQRPCRLKFICTSRKTGLVCMLRKKTSKIVPISSNKCAEERVPGFIYTLSSSY